MSAFVGLRLWEKIGRCVTDDVLFNHRRLLSAIRDLDSVPFEYVIGGAQTGRHLVAADGFEKLVAAVTQPLKLPVKETELILNLKDSLKPGGTSRLCFGPYKVKSSILKIKVDRYVWMYVGRERVRGDRRLRGPDDARNNFYGLAYSVFDTATRTPDEREFENRPLPPVTDVAQTAFEAFSFLSAAQQMKEEFPGFLIFPLEFKMALVAAKPLLFEMAYNEEDLHRFKRSMSAFW